MLQVEGGGGQWCSQGVFSAEFLHKNVKSTKSSVLLYQLSLW